MFSTDMFYCFIYLIQTEPLPGVKQCARNQGCGGYEDWTLNEGFVRFDDDKLNFKR